MVATSEEQKRVISTHRAGGAHPSLSAARTRVVKLDAARPRNIQESLVSCVTFQNPILSEPQFREGWQVEKPVGSICITDYNSSYYNGLCLKGGEKWKIKGLNILNG